jgi:hypothetical protein
MPDIASEALHQARNLRDWASHHLQPSRQKASDQGRWLVVTIDRTPDEVAPGGQLPAMLAALGEAVEVEVRPAPRNQGTELAARPTGDDLPTMGSPSGDALSGDPHAVLRQVLRQVKQLAEVGEVLRNEPRPEGRRPRTLGGMLVDRAEERADHSGVL